MTEQGYRKSPNEIDMRQAERAIRKAGLLSFLLFGASVVAGYFVLPAFFNFPESLPHRIAFAAQASIFVLFCVVVAVSIVSTARRSSAADIGGSAARSPSDKIAIYVAFLSNTLEQAVIAVGLYFALATLVSDAWLTMIPVSVIFFLVGRILFLRGYAKGAEGRAFGMALTMVPTAIGYFCVLVLLVSKWF